MSFVLTWQDGDQPSGRLELSAADIGLLCKEMTEQGMAYESQAPSLPDPADYGVPLDQFGVPREQDPAFPAYVVDLLGALSWTDPGGRGIALHKLATQDDWLITSEEIESALRSATEQALLIPPDRADLWAQWLDFIRGARDRGGINVS
jgi:hypothetical protein